MKPDTTDKAIEQAVRRELARDPALDATHLDVTTRDSQARSRLTASCGRGLGARAHLPSPSGRR